MCVGWWGGASGSSDVARVVAHFCYQSEKLDFDLLFFSLHSFLFPHRERTAETHVHHMQQEMLLLSESAGTQKGEARKCVTVRP